MNNNKPFMLGIGVVLALTIVSFFAAEVSFIKALSFSPMIVGILLGMVFANIPKKPLPEGAGAGIKFCSKKILRLGIILYGFRLTLIDISEVGVAAVVVDAIIVCGTIALGLFIGKLLKMDKDLTLLTSCGSAICGAAAVLGVEGALRAKPYKTAVAVSTVVIFGTIAMFLYPMLYRAGFFCLPENLMGIYTGSTVHEVAHVVGAGNAMGEEISSVSIIVKMIRVMMLVPVLLALAFCIKPKSNDESGISVSVEPEGKPKSSITIPWFAILFLVVVLINSFVSIPESVIGILNLTSTFCLTMAMTALGVETTFDKFRQSGAKPFILASILFVWLMLGGWLMAKFLVPLF